MVYSLLTIFKACLRVMLSLLRICIPSRGTTHVILRLLLHLSAIRALSFLWTIHLIWIWIYCHQPSVGTVWHETCLCFFLFFQIWKLLLFVECVKNFLQASLIKIQNRGRFLLCLYTFAEEIVPLPRWICLKRVTLVLLLDVIWFWLFWHRLVLHLD